MTTTEITVHSEGLRFSAEQRRILLDSFASGATEQEFAVLIETAQARGLDPFKREIFFVKRWDAGKSREVWATQVSIDGLRLVAARSGVYAGQDEPEFEERDGMPVLCRVRVHRSDWQRPAVGVARWSEYVQTTRDKQSGQTRPNAMWAKMPFTMLAKCAEALAIRKAFPESAAGLYTADEMGQAENDAPQRAHITVEPVTPPQLPAPKRPALDVFRDAIDRDGTLAAIVVTWHAHCAALAAEKAADDAAADVAKWLAEGGYVLSKTEQQALLAHSFTLGMLALLDALAMQTAAPLVMRWRLDADIARAIEALPEHHAKTVKTVVARTWCKLSEIVTERPNVTFAKAVEALNPKPPPTGTDSPSSARGDTGAADATPADATPSAEAQESIARVGDPYAYLATKATYTELERAVVAHGAHVPALAAAAVARLEALGEGGDDGNRSRLVAAWVSESASRAQRAERTASQVRRAA